MSRESTLLLALVLAALTAPSLAAAMEHVPRSPRIIDLGDAESGVINLGTISGDGPEAGIAVPPGDDWAGPPNHNIVTVPDHVDAEADPMFYIYLAVCVGAAGVYFFVLRWVFLLAEDEVRCWHQRSPPAFFPPPTSMPDGQRLCPPRANVTHEGARRHRCFGRCMFPHIPPPLPVQSGRARKRPGSDGSSVPLDELLSEVRSQCVTAWEWGACRSHAACQRHAPPPASSSTRRPWRRCAGTRTPMIP